MSAQRIYGNKWSKISKFLPGRTDNAIKNRFHVLTRATTKNGCFIGSSHREESINSLPSETIQREEILSLLNDDSYHLKYSPIKSCESDDAAKLPGIDEIISSLQGTQVSFSCLINASNEASCLIRQLRQLKDELDDRIKASNTNLDSVSNIFCSNVP